MYEHGDKVTHPLCPGQVLDVVRYGLKHHVYLRAPGGSEILVAEHTAFRQGVLTPPERHLPPLRPLEVFKVFEEVRKACVQMNLDWRGHFRKGQDWDAPGWNSSPQERRERRERREGLFGMMDFEGSPDDCRDILNTASEHGARLKVFRPLFRWSRLFACPHCESDFGYESDGQTIRPTKPCPNPEGLVSRATLNVPSGFILMDDSLSDIYPAPMKHDINRTWGQHMRFEAHARMGEIVGQVGNTCPSLIRLADGTYQIGNFDKPVWFIETDEGEVPVDTRPEGGSEWPDDHVLDLPEGASYINTICTSRWSYSAMDWDDAVKRIQTDRDPLDDHPERFRVEVGQGTYLFEHFNFPDRGASPCVMAQFKRIGDATPPVDYARIRDEHQVTAGQAVQMLARDWPDLYGKKDWAHTCAAVFAHVFNGCVPSRDWNKNGFPNDYFPGDEAGVKDREIPRMRFPVGFDMRLFDTVVSRQDRLFGGDIPLNPSFARAALRILESQISFGPTIPFYRGSSMRDILEASRKDMRRAVKNYYGIRDRYPDAVQGGLEDFDNWMGVEGNAEITAWVEHFYPAPEEQESHEN